MTEQGEDRLAGLSLTDRELFDRLGWFNRIRWLAVLLAALLVLLCWYLWGLRFPAHAVVAVLLAICAYNAASIMFAQACYEQHEVTRRRIIVLGNAQIICDLIAVVVLVHYTGGIENLFLVFAVFPLIIASELLSRWNAYLCAAAAALLVHVMAWLEYFNVLPHVPIEGLGTIVGYHDPLHVFYVCTVATLVFFIVVFFAGTIAGRLRSREAQLERAYDELSKVDRVKSYFMHRVSHELRAPLSTAYSLLGAILGMEETPESKRAEMIQRAQVRLRNLVDVVDDLLRYSKIKEAPAEGRADRVNLARVVEQVCDFIRVIATDKDQTFEQRIRPAVVLGDAEELTEMVTNLVSNAVRYTPDGGKIRVELTSEESQAVLTVSDTGIGIDPEAMGHIFEEFYRAPNAKKMVASGTGLGLSIVRQVVAHHFGKIEVTSRPGQGTTFRVRLPLTPR